MQAKSQHTSALSPTGIAARVNNAIFDMIAAIPPSMESKSDAPEVRVRALSEAAARSTAKISGLAALAPGPLGLMTLLPDLIAMWKIQSQLVADIAAVYGKTTALGKEQMLYCLFRHSASQMMRDIVYRAGERYLVHPASLRVMQKIIAAIGVKISQRVIELTAPAKRINAGVDASEDYRVVDILQFILGVVAPRTVICVGAAAQRVVHSMDLSGSPAIIATREFIDWDTDYEHALAEEVNNPTAAATCGQRTRDAKSRGQTGSALRSWLAGLR